jgi:hypothetical protein
VARYFDVPGERNGGIPVHREANSSILICLIVSSETRPIEKNVEILIGNGLAISAVHEPNRDGDILCRERRTPNGEEHETSK